MQGYTTPEWRGRCGGGDVLDSAHHPERIRAAVTRPELRRNWLLQQFVADLRNESGSFEIEYDRYPIIGDVCTGQDFYRRAALLFLCPITACLWPGWYATSRRARVFA